jgi:hypothetical protein
VIQRQLGHADLGITSAYLRGIDNTEIIQAVHDSPSPTIPATAGLIPKERDCCASGGGLRTCAVEFTRSSGRQCSAKQGPIQIESVVAVRWSRVKALLASTDTFGVSGGNESLPPPGWDRLSVAPISEQEQSGGSVPVSRPRARLVALLVGLAVVGGVAAATVLPRGARASVPSIRGGSFSTRYPVGWTLTVTHPVVGVSNYSLGSTGTKLDELGIPSPGEAGLTISEYSLATLAALADPSAASQNPFVLLAHVVGVPRLAESRDAPIKLHATTLDGAPAAAIVYRYTYGGIENIQSDVVARRGSMVVSIETDADPLAAAQATAAMTSVMAQWRWRQTQSGHDGSAAPTTSSSTPRADAASIVGRYDVVGSVLLTGGFSGERPGDLLSRNWSIQRTCTHSKCRLILTRTLAAITGLPPISAVLIPTSGGWTAHFAETQGCPDPDSPTRSTEYSTFSMWATPTGLEAIEHGQARQVGNCEATYEDVHWYADKQTGRPSQLSAT